ncbi:nonribosomal peptide synthetase MxaA [Methylorubrum sp. Q1]|uniref:nonribosomal peptide synthetase MxaA n=1 Tax=Methylorubrum sp. Q1 TaxID=2562453 RepID=UPI0010768CE6|nr:nonribosomal peptide synthetase MxaA [Methylorubrum sp. Q1]TFZ60345.1 nonribosomal peptide synthetase MxaA [Methylorubrum sp. Q1]
MRALPLALLLALVSLPASAQVRGVELRTPRAFGYFQGDLVQVQAEIRTDPGFTLQRPSLPKPGPVTYWLDLRDVRTEESRGADGANVIRLRLTYQDFYVALDARTLEVPGFPVTVESAGANGSTTAVAQLPAWKIGVSPLREVQPERRDDPAEYLRPDGRAPRLDPQPALASAAGFLALAVLALVLLAYDRAWWFFGRRRGRPFALALKALGRARQQSQGEALYREALLALHRGLDATDGRRVLADDLPDFLGRHPAFRGQAGGLERFFSASRLAFFGRDTAGAGTTLPLPEVEALLRRLGAVERSA